MLKNKLNISITKIESFFQYLEKKKIDKSSALKKAGISPDILKHPDNKISIAQLDDLIGVLQKLTNDKFIGLHLGEGINKNFSSIIGYVLMNCSTLNEALIKYCKYEKLIDEGTKTIFYDEGKDIVIESVMRDKSLNNINQLDEYKISGTLAYTKMLTGRDFPVKKIQFSHQSPGDTKEHCRIFGCPVHFNQSRTAFIINKSYMSMPIREPNSAMLPVFEKIAEETLKTAEETESYTKKAGRIILDRLKGEIPTIDIVAKRMAMSVRSLQLNLKKEGITFRQLLDNIRKDIATRYLSDNSAEITEIAYLLGFSEASAFHRTFKRWTDLTPGEYRLKKTPLSK